MIERPGGKVCLDCQALSAVDDGVLTQGSEIKVFKIRTQETLQNLYFLSGRAVIIV